MTAPEEDRESLARLNASAPCRGPEELMALERRISPTREAQNRENAWRNRRARSTLKSLAEKG